MFGEIIEKIKSKEFEYAITLLDSLLNGDEQTIAKAKYLLGYIYSCRENKNRNKHRAKRYLLENINSPYPIPHAYVLYADLIEDKNVAINYLKKGIAQYPQNVNIYRSLLRFTENKMEVIEKIENAELMDVDLLKDVIEELVKIGNWQCVNRFVVKIRMGEQISDYEEMYLNLLTAYSILFGIEENHIEAIRLFQNIIEKDIDNQLAYSPYLGLIFALIKNGEIDMAKSYFDKIPLNNIIYDLNEGPWHFIFIDFSNEYKVIFSTISKTFSADRIRKAKAKALYSLYLYYPSEIYDIYRYKKSDLKSLENIIKKEFNRYVAAALFHMYCHFNNYVQANQIFIKFLVNYEDPERYNVFYNDITDNTSADEFGTIVQDLIMTIETFEDFDTKKFAKCALKEIIERLFQDVNYSLISQLADFFTDDEIYNCKCAFKSAYSYAEEGKTRALNLYEKIIEKEPNNSSVLNNLGILLENDDNLEKASIFLKKACKIKPTEEKYKINLQRVKQKIIVKEAEVRAQKQLAIRNITKNVTLEYLEEIGYTDELRECITRISDSQLKAVLLRDLEECAISIAVRQDKAATIMCGSIIEALLLAQIVEIGKKNYDITDISKNKNAKKYPIIDMNLNELLYVADKEKLICKNNFHLSHYVRDYRNVVHPAKEIRTKQNITHENVMIMWAILKQIIYELLQ